MISEPEDGGAILVDTVSVTPTTFSAVLRLKPEKCLEPAGHFKQWFYFEAQDLPVAQGTRLEFEIVDAGESTYNEWDGYRVCMSRDRLEWTRVAQTTFKDGVLRWEVNNNTFPSAWFAYFPPYSLERQLDLIATAQARGPCTAVIIGMSVEKRDLHALVFSPDGANGPAAKAAGSNQRPVVWIQHRQHPGETAASWFCEGVIQRLTSNTGDERVSRLLAAANVVVVPNLNPDGGKHGYLRTNAQGANLNRCWGGFHGLVAPGQSDPPALETEAIMQSMREWGGVDLMLDVHQDEEKPYVFISKTPFGVPSYAPEMRELHERFKSTLQSYDPNFQTPGPVEPVGYPEPEPGKANLNVCSASVAEAFPGCLSMTLEMPYKGNANAGADAAMGWTTDQCRHLGSATIDAIADTLPHLIRPKRSHTSR